MNDTYLQPEHGWTCFHCGETFKTVGGARDHFGADPSKEPGCLIRVKYGDERGLQMELREAEDEIERLRTENKSQAAMLERDRTLVADCVTSMRKTLMSREWLRLGRGSYEYDDDRWKSEFGEAYNEIMKEIKKLETVAANWEGCPKTQADVVEARRQIPHPTQGLDHLPKGRWHHGYGVICCGTIRIARADFDTITQLDKQNAVLQAVCDALNAINNGRLGKIVKQ